ncbi:MAG TPA: hypothetical protein DCL43_00975 [Chitinophagaceae bacterium]|nr:hypothetical protein [Chitinophagaceae bacterium]HAN37659.1 hypothetical protein [Chitinophagaceae bacterium]
METTTPKATTVVVINPSQILAGDAQSVTADLSKFDVAKQQADLVKIELDKYQLITTEEIATKAIETASMANKVVKAIEEKRKLIVTPWNDEVKKINSYAKGLMEPIEKAVNAVKKSVIVFQEQQERIRIQQLLQVRGTILTGLGFKLHTNGNYYVCKEIDAIMSKSEMTTLNDAQFNQAVAGYEASLKAYDEEQQRKAALAAQEAAERNEINNAFSNTPAPEPVVTAVTPTKVPTRTVTASIATTTISSSFKAKGTTVRWVFQVENINEVPREYMMVDEAKIRKAVQDGVRSIPGVRIYEDKSITLR